MSKKDNSAIERRSLVKAMGAATVAGLAMSGTAAQAQQSGSGGFEPRRHNEDAWLGELAGNHRVFVDTSTAPGASNGLLYSMNILNAHRQAYGGNDADYAIVICFRHFSTPYAFSDEIWAKYGEIFHGITQMPDPRTGEIPAVNLVNVAETLPAGAGMTKNALEARGLKVAICASATNFFSNLIAENVGASREEIFAELTGSITANSRMASAGVIATTRAQEYGYSLLYAA